MKLKIMLIRVTGALALLLIVLAFLAVLALVGFIGSPILTRIESKSEGALFLAAMTSLWPAYVFWRGRRFDPRTKKYEPATPAERRLGSWVVRWMTVYAAIALIFGWAVDIHTLPIWMKVPAALSFALPVGGMIVALLKYLSDEPDEFQRMLMARSVLAATGLTLFLFTAWGSLEVYAGAPLIPIEMLATPIFCGMFAIATFWVQRRYT